MTRVAVVWVPDWPLVAAGVTPDVPAAVLSANRVVACTAAARRAGVRAHQRRREAQARCPSLVVLDHDPDRDARAFHPVLHALEDLTPRLELSRPGRCVFAARGPSRYFGGDTAMARRAVTLVGEALSTQTSISVDAGRSAEVAVGVADGSFAASQAARRARRHADRVHVVKPGASPSFLAPLPIVALDRPALTDVLARLGIATLGDFAALPAPDVLARFGVEGQRAHRLAAGLDEVPPRTAEPPPQMTVSAELDPPAAQVAQVAFVARGLADELADRLAERGSATTRVVIGAETGTGERCERVWRQEVALSPGAIVDRVRWQLDGWLLARRRERPPEGQPGLRGRERPPEGQPGIVRVWIEPDDVVPADGRQLGFWGGDAAAARRAGRAVTRLSGLFGPDAVLVPERRGGRNPVDQIALIPAGATDLADRSTLPGRASPGIRPDSVAAPWPGRLPAPSPASIHPDPLPAEVFDAEGALVGVDGRGEVSAPPVEVRLPGQPTRSVMAWAGPWPVDERWWDPAQHRRRARFQVVTDDDVGRLMVVEHGRWHVEATYD